MSQIIGELRTRTEAVWDRLSGQIPGMEVYMERPDAPAEWTARQVLCHLLGEPGWRPVSVLSTFATTELPLIEIKPGQTHVTPERQMMRLQPFTKALDRHRREVFEYLESLGDEDLQRKARIPLFKEFLGTDEVTIPTWVGVFFGAHCSGHSGHLRQIPQRVGLPEA